MNSNFSWVPFYHELAERVLEFENRQDELLAVLREMKTAGLYIVPLEDDISSTERVAFTQIDPFTFLANFSRTSDKEAIKLCGWIRTKWDMTTPTPQDFDGRANVHPQGGASWFFASTERGRKAQDIPLLWTVAKAVFKDGVSALDQNVYSKVLGVENVGANQFSVGLFWLRPSDFLPMVGPVLPYLKAKGVRWDEKLLRQKPFCQLSEYIKLCDHARSVNPDFVSLSYNAWLQSKEKLAVQATIDSPLINPFPSLNRILYGPPGTGKTFSSISQAVAIIDGSFPNDRVECQTRFHKLRASGQIGFVTFHQSFSYEEFVEGLRPIIKDGDGAVQYEIRAGVLKEMALTAVSRSLKRITSNRATFEQLWSALLEKVEDEEWLLPGIGSSQYKLTLTPSGNLTGENIRGNAQQPYNASRDKIERVWKELRDGPVATHALIIGILKVGSHSNLIGAVVEELKRIEKILPQSVIRSADVEQSAATATSFLTGLSDYRTDFQNAPKFILIIDEINRGNISKIFGELITLLEEDKRLGEPNELRVTLPTSGETFALPPNLYILGTMNTADKSLAQLDVALRRRFDFEELAPRPELCDKLEGLPDILKALNERLEWALDRDHRLGHAYLMDVGNEEMFNARFRSKVVPLLIEYFPHDFATLRAVLGEEDSSASDGFLRELIRPKGFKSGLPKYRWWFEVPGKDFSAFKRLKSNFGIS